MSDDPGVRKVTMDELVNELARVALEFHDGIESVVDFLEPGAFPALISECKRRASNCSP